MAMLGNFGGHTKVTFYPWSAILLWMAVALACPIPGWWTQGDKPPGYHTSNSDLLTEGAQANLGLIRTRWMNKRHFPVCFIIPLHERHWDRWDRESVAFPPKPKLTDCTNWTQLQPLGLVQKAFYTLVHLCRPNDSDAMIMMLQSSASPFGQEKSLHMHSRAMPTHLHICRCPWPTPYILTWTTKLNFIPQFLQLWHIYVCMYVPMHAYIYVVCMYISFM